MLLIPSDTMIEENDAGVEPSFKLHAALSGAIDFGLFW